MNRVGILPAVIGLTLVPVAACGGASEEIKIPSNGPYAPEIDLASFARSAGIDNPYFPLSPGTTRIFEGTDEGDTVRIEEYVTYDTKEILGVTS